MLRGDIEAMEQARQEIDGGYRGVERLEEMTERVLGMTEAAVSKGAEVEILRWAA